MAATNRPDDIDPALRRPGRFDRELRINPPSDEGRKEILQIHTRGMPLEDDVNFDELSRRTIGYVGADLEVLCKEAGLKAIKPHFAKLKNEDKKISAEELDKIRVSRQDFVDALKKVEPSAMREVLIKKPNVKWSDVGGLREAKEKLRELVELPLLRPELYKAAGIKPSKGVLLYGPPGTGKTLLAKAVATEANANFISVKGPELISKWVGESEKHVRDIFKKAKQVSPAIIFFDEFDSISKSRGASGGSSDSSEKVVNQLLTELDGIEDLENVMVIAATNRKDLIDAALLRPGRIDSHVELGLPDEETREQIFNVHIKNMPLEKSVDVKKMAHDSEGWTGADIEAVCRNAGISSIKRNYKEKDMSKVKITVEDFSSAFKDISKQKEVPQIGPEGTPDMNEILKSLPQSDKKKINDKLKEVEAREEKKTSKKKNSSKKTPKK
jgi:transitional endoplasmic reticulum ATPase